MQMGSCRSWAWQLTPAWRALSASLVAAGCSVEVKPGSLDIVSAAVCKCPGAVAVLVEAGADIHPPLPSETNLLHVATLCGAHAAVGPLVMAGLDVDACWRRNMAPLMVAAARRGPPAGRGPPAHITSHHMRAPAGHGRRCAGGQRLGLAGQQVRGSRGRARGASRAVAEG